MKVFGGNYGDRANQENNAYILVMPMVVTMIMMTLLMVMTNLIWILYNGGDHENNVDNDDDTEYNWHDI